MCPFSWARTHFHCIALRARALKVKTSARSCTFSITYGHTAHKCINVYTHARERTHACECAKTCAQRSALERKCESFEPNPFCALSAHKYRQNMKVSHFRGRKMHSVGTHARVGQHRICARLLEQHTKAIRNFIIANFISSRSSLRFQQNEKTYNMKYSPPKRTNYRHSLVDRLKLPAK